MDELQLIRSAQAGSTSCFTQLVLLYQKKLLGFLLAHYHRRDLAEDVVQETFINAWRYINSYDCKWQFNTWLYTIARRVAGKYLKQLQNESSLLSESETPYENIMVKKDNIWNQIRHKLEDDPFDVIWFYYVDELKVTDIADILQKSESWVKVTLHRTRKILANINELKSAFEHLKDDAKRSAT